MTVLLSLRRWDLREVVYTGWNNYIIIPELKLAIRVSRELDEGNFYEYEDQAKKFFDLTHFITEELNYECFEKPLHKLTLDDLTDVLKIAKESADALMHLYELDKLLIYWLVFRNMKFEVISEFQFEKRKEEFKDYTVFGE